MHSKSKNKSKQTIYLCRVPLCPLTKKFTKRKTMNAHTRKQHPNVDMDKYLWPDEEPESEKKLAKIAQQAKEKAAKAEAKEASKATKKLEAEAKAATKKLEAEAKAALKQSQVGAKAAKKPDKRSRVNGMSTDSNKKPKNGGLTTSFTLIPHQLFSRMCSFLCVLSCKCECVCGLCVWCMKVPPTTESAAGEVTCWESPTRSPGEVD
jgi:hypothetical protein